MIDKHAGVVSIADGPRRARVPTGVVDGLALLRLFILLLEPVPENKVKHEGQKGEQVGEWSNVRRL